MTVKFPGVKQRKRPKKGIDWPRDVRVRKPDYTTTGVRLMPLVQRKDDWKRFYLQVAPTPGPTTSEPESLVFGWLVRNDVPFGYQVDILGGRQVPGGAVLDFVLYFRHPLIVIRLMGYYHKFAGQVARDDAQLSYLHQEGYVVYDVWEYEISTEDRLNDTMRKIVYGT